MDIDTRKLRKVLNKMFDELDNEPKTKKEFGNNLRDIAYGIGYVGNYAISLEITEWDCPASEMANIADVVSGKRDTNAK